MQKPNSKVTILWIALILLIGLLGALVYYFVSSFASLPSGPSPLSSSTTDQASISPGRDNSRNVLRIPPILQDQNADPDVAEFELAVQSGQTRFFSDRLTATLGYNGSYLGPVLRIRTGEKVQIRVNNQLDFPTTVHWHGMVVDGEQDGGPHQGIQPGESWQPIFTVDQSAATLWFHPHIMGSTADQVYYGLAGLIYIDDEQSDRLNLPDMYGVNDFPLIVQDRNFNRDGSFAYRTSMMGVVAGDTILVNGTINPALSVNRGKVRFRILNASNALDFHFTMSDGSPFIQIASDGGLMEAPVTRSSIFLAPGERAEVIADFSKFKQDRVSIMLNQQPMLEINLAPTSDAGSVPSQSTDKTESPDMDEIPRFLTSITPIPIGDKPRTRIFELQSMGISGTINGKSFDMNRIDEEVTRNETEIWVIRNRGGMMQTSGHPFHVHGTQFQVVSRNGKAPPEAERGFKDTVFVGIGEEVKIRVRFTHPGIYMYHCHILEHEDNGMMGQFRVS